MSLTEKLDLLMKDRGLTRGSLSKATGIPYTTIVGFYEKGSENIKLSNLKKLAAFFDVSVEYLCSNDIPPENVTINKMAKKYAALSSKGKRIVDNMIDGLVDLETETEPSSGSGEITYIREYVTPAAAGYTSPAEGEDYVIVPVTSDVPRGTDYAVRIAGDSMEPYIADGSRVFVNRTNELSPGDVGIFFVDGDMKCKQYCEDAFGNIYLFSLNRVRSDADSFISSSSGVCVYCFGKVLLAKRPPLPKM